MHSSLQRRRSSKGTGRFGPFIKWDGLFINVSKKYNFDNLSQQDIEVLIEDKIQKNIDKVLHNWEDEGILVEKALGTLCNY
jgi:DNA topoisomerase-1